MKQKDCFAPIFYRGMLFPTSKSVFELLPFYVIEQLGPV